MAHVPRMFRCTRRLMGPPSFLERIMDDTKHFTRTVTRLEGITGPTMPFEMIEFNEKDKIDKCKTMSDKDMGGFSSVNLDFVPKEGESPAHARFHGTINTDLPPNRPHIVRSGYAGWATYDRKSTFFTKGFWDIEPYTHLCLKVRSDGRKYFVNIRTDSLVETDIHQHRLTTKQPGKWETVVLDLNQFVRTNYGEVVNPQNEMLKEKVKSVGVSLIDRIPKPYELHIARVWATNFRGDDEFKDDPLHRPQDWEDEQELAERERRPARRRNKLPDHSLM